MKNREISYTEIGKRLRQIRREKGLTQADFGQLLGGYKWHQIRDLESGKVKPSADLVLRIADEFGVSANWLMTGETREELNEKFESLILRKAAELKEEDFKMIEILKSRGIDSVEQLEKFFELSRAAYSLARVAEEVKKYEGKKKSPKRQGGKP